MAATCVVGSCRRTWVLLHSRQRRALVALRTGLFLLDLETEDLNSPGRGDFDKNLIRFNEGAFDSTGHSGSAP